jgi:hypothetical protein
MIDRREIMNTAWTIFREARARYGAWQLVNREEGTFAGCLRQAWRIVKAATARVVARMKEEAAMDGPNGPAIRAIKHAISELQFKSFRHNIAAERKSLEARLASLITA